MLKDDFDCHFIICNPLPGLKKQILETCKTIIELPFITNEAKYLAKFLTGSEIVVLDGYHFNTDYQRIIRESGCKVVSIDDIHTCHFVSDVVINHAPGVNPSNYSVESYTNIFLGLDYSLIRKPFLEAAKKERNISKIKNIFICFGGADYNNITMKVLKSITKKKLPQIENINVVLGGANEFKKQTKEFVQTVKNVTINTYEALSADQMTNLMQENHLAIVPASSILYEILAVKMPVISGFYVDNQINIYQGFNSLGVICGVGDFNQFDRYPETISIIIKDRTDKILKLQKHYQKGHSQQNFLNLFHTLQN